MSVYAQRFNKLKRDKHKLKEEGPFGSGTPSSKKPFKKKATEASTKAKSGSKPGHTAHGRGKHAPDEVDKIIELSLPEACPDCGGTLTLTLEQQFPLLKNL